MPLSRLSALPKEKVGLNEESSPEPVSRFYHPCKKLEGDNARSQEFLFE
jgi:hypothetical protein